jgi:hypothetical protein
MVLPHENNSGVVQLDAIEFLRMLPDNSIHLVVTDPAYESLEKHRAKGTTTRLKESKASSNTWFPIFRDTGYPPFLNELYRVMKPRSHAYIFCDETTADILKPIAQEAGFKVWKCIIWVKTTKTTDGLWETLRDAMGTVLAEVLEDDKATFARSMTKLLRGIKRALSELGSAVLADRLTRTGMGYHWRGACERILFLEKRTMPQPWPHNPHSERSRSPSSLSSSRTAPARVRWSSTPSRVPAS